MPEVAARVPPLLPPAAENWLRAGSFARGSTDLSFRAGLSAFLQWLARREDAATLFFNRELSIVGDTELGLLVRNVPDAIN